MRQFVIRSVMPVVVMLGAGGGVGIARGSSGTLFTYQGQLKLNGAPMNGSADFEFTLWNAASGGDQVGTLVAKDAVVVEHGLFHVGLDFGAGALNGARWLAISVRSPSGVGVFEPVLPRQQITASPYSIQTRGIFVDGGGRVGIGTSDPQESLHVRSGQAALRLEDDNDPNSFTALDDVQPTQLVFSKTNSDGMVLMDINPRPMDGVSDAKIRVFRGTSTSGRKEVVFHRGNDSTQASAAIGVDGTDSFFQLHGGNVGIGLWQSEVRLHVDGGTDVAPVGGGFIQCGPSDGPNVAIDDNEIMARSNGSTSTLFLNNNGGDVVVGGDLDVGLEFVQVTSSAGLIEVSCPTGKRVIAGGCDGGLDEIEKSIPNDDRTGWICDFNGGNSTAFAICARVK